MTDALAGPHSKPFVMSSATGFMGNTGPHPVSEEFVVDVEHPLAARCLPERVRVVHIRCMQRAASNSLTISDAGLGATAILIDILYSCRTPSRPRAKASGPWRCAYHHMW